LAKDESNSASDKEAPPDSVAQISGDDRRKLAKAIETTVLVPNHKEAVGIIRANIHLANADSEFEVHRPANSPPEADCNRHPRPVETATPGRRHRAVRRGKLPLTNNFYLVRREVVN
jgi:hypothetical protein